MSDEQTSPEASAGDAAPPPAGKAVPPLIVAVVLIAATVVAGFVGVRRYQSLKAETMREVQQDMRLLQEDIRQLREEAAAAARAEEPPATDGAPTPAPD